MVRSGFRTAGALVGFLLRLGPLLFEHFLKRFTGVPDVLSEQIARGNNISSAAEFENLMVFFVGSLHAVRQI